MSNSTWIHTYINGIFFHSTYIPVKSALFLLWKAYTSTNTVHIAAIPAIRETMPISDIEDLVPSNDKVSWIKKKLTFNIVEDNLFEFMNNMSNTVNFGKQSVNL